MSRLQPAVGQHVFLSKSEFAQLIAVLKAEGYSVIGPRMEAGMIVMREVSAAEDLARGVRDEQSPGRYQLVPGHPDMLFEYVVGMHSPKGHVFPPMHPIFRMRVDGQGQFAVDAGPPQPPRLALIGVRPCDVAALQVLDRVLTGGSRCEIDAYYLRARQQMLIVAVNCSTPGSNCFCASMGTGPEAGEGCDLALTELRAGFVMKVGSARGAQLAAQLEVREPAPAELELAELRMERAREHMGRKLDTTGLKALLEQTVEHPHWDEIAKRCLSCGNCTMVCPTCACSSVVDANDLTGGGVTRTRVWDCCYTHQFSYTTAGPVRHSVKARHRHWLRHKLCTFVDQYDVMGCVGCGRCITWCPVGIDLTEEVAEIRREGHAPAQFERQVVS